MNPFTSPLELQRQVVEEASDAIETAAVAPDRLADMGAVEVGTTPSEVVYEENKLELHRYDAGAAGIEPDVEQEVPILVTYALINRPYILDLQPDRSVVRRLLEHGFDVYLIDWGEPSLLDASLTLYDYVVRYIDNCVEVVLERTGREDLNLLGYCMGGTMAAMYAALHPAKVRNLGLMAASLCFDDTGGVLELWGSEEYYAPATVADAFGTVPAEFFDLGFALMDPVQNTTTKYVHLVDNLEDEDFVENFARMERWLAEGIDMAGATYRQFLEGIYQGNDLYRNELDLDGRHVDVTNIDMPVLQITAEYDHLVPPRASTPFNDVISSEDVTVMQARSGHIGLSVSASSHRDLWPRVCDWFAERSDREPDLEAVDGIGPAYAERLRGADVETVADLLEADPETLGAAIDVSPTRIEGWIERAAALYGD